MGQTRPQTLYFKEEKSQDNIKSSFGVLGGPKVTSWADSYNQHHRERLVKMYQTDCGGLLGCTRTTPL